MPNTKSAKKRVRQIRKRTIRNKIIKARVKTAIKNFNKALENQENVEEALRMAVKTIDKAASKGVIHKNNAARKKSKLYKKYNEIIENVS